MSEANGTTVVDRIDREVHQLKQSLMPLLDRAHLMLVRSPDRLETCRSGGRHGQLSMGHAGQVNLGSAVRNGGVMLNRCPPERQDQAPCGFWLKRELETVRPKLVVTLGATAMLALTGRSVEVTRERARIMDVNGLRILVTVHPPTCCGFPTQVPQGSSSTASSLTSHLPSPWGLPEEHETVAVPA